MSQETRTPVQTLPLEALSYEEQFPEEYEALRGYGLSAFYALRVLVDFMRGDSTASRLITMAKSSREAMIKSREIRTS